MLHEDQHLKVLDKINNAYKLQKSRSKRSNSYNHKLHRISLEDRSLCSPEALDLLRKALDPLGISTRGYFKILNVARTIADLESARLILPQHISEALQLRPPPGLS